MPSASFPRRSRGANTAQGFALLVTITLLAFLVLLLVSLATLTRVETQVAANTQQSSQARQTALLALSVAIGQLQKYAGPDQRITARADLRNAADGAHGRWVGVYGNALAAGPDPSPTQLETALTAAGMADANGSTARLLTWLVSGNERVAFDPDTAVGTAGEILQAPAADGIPFQPARPVHALTTAPATTALSTDITIENVAGEAIAARLLVGPHTVTSAMADGVALDYVAAPLVNVSLPATAVPGLGGTASDHATVGRYAWWIGDEGMKARLNLPLTESLDGKPAAFASAQRAAVELMSRETPSWPAPALTSARIGLDYASAGPVANLLAAGQLSLTAETAVQAAALRTAAIARFHDLTARSETVLSDSSAGGLKKDLAALLATGASSPADTQVLFKAEGVAGYGVPTWGHLRAFSRHAVPSSDLLAPVLPSATDAGVFPVLTYAAVGFQFASADTPAEGTGINLNLFPLVVLWNPYTTALAAGIYEVGLTVRASNGRMELQFETAPGVWTKKVALYLNRGGAPEGTGTAGTYFRFLVSSPPLPPGQSLVFTLQGTAGGVAYAAGTNVLTNGLNPAGYARMESVAVFAAGEAGLRFRVADEGSLLSGETDAYLGPAGAAGPVGYDPAGKNWYQAIQRVGYGSTPSLLQGGAAPFSAPGPGTASPAFCVRVQAMFSGQGSNSVHNVPHRWIAQANPRAPLVGRTKPDTSKNPLYDSRIKLGVSEWQHFTVAPPGTRASAGRGHDLGSDGNPVDVTLFEFPEAGKPLRSIGQLQHAPLSLLGAYPSYAVGNSLADYRIPADKVHRDVSGATQVATNLVENLYDLSWLLNRALWDRYFASTIPAAGAIPAALDNPRLVRFRREGTGPTDAQLRDADRAASHLLLAGGFNLNSTSEQAWRAVLGGINRLAYDPVTRADGVALGPVLSRFSRPTAGSDLTAAWSGYRVLTEEQIAQLARNLVAEIRARGPFVSLADFINRRLVDNATTAADERLKGTLQAALDATTTAGAEAFPVNDAATAPFRPGDETGSSPPLTDFPDYIAAHILGNTSGTKVAPYGARSAFAPKFLTQADILSAVGAGLAARSDTFLVRTCGETVNPFLDSADAGYITGRAWCEAVVQRLPDYVNGADSSESAPSLAENRHFGRKFKIISFRWLTPHDI